MRQEPRSLFQNMCVQLLAAKIRISRVHVLALNVRMRSGCRSWVHVLAPVHVFTRSTVRYGDPGANADFAAESFKVHVLAQNAERSARSVFSIGIHVHLP